LKFLDRAAIVALGLGLVAQEQRPARGGFRHPVEAFAQCVVAVLCAGDLDIGSEFLGQEEDGLSVGIERFAEAGGEEAGLEARGAEQRLLCEGDAFDGEEFLGIDRLIDGEEVGTQVIDFLEFFETDDGEGGGSESVFAGVLSGAGLALGSAGAGGPGGVGAIGSELFFGDWFTVAGHGDPRFSEVAREMVELIIVRRQVAERRGVILMEGRGLKMGTADFWRWSRGLEARGHESGPGCFLKLKCVNAVAIERTNVNAFCAATFWVE
jgi:hypothetical protein